MLVDTSILYMTNSCFILTRDLCQLPFHREWTKRLLDLEVVHFCFTPVNITILSFERSGYLSSRSLVQRSHHPQASSSLLFCSILQPLVFDWPRAVALARSSRWEAEVRFWLAIELQEPSSHPAHCRVLHLYRIHAYLLKIHCHLEAIACGEPWSVYLVIFTAQKHPADNWPTDPYLLFFS